MAIDSIINGLVSLALAGQAADPAAAVAAPTEPAVQVAAEVVAQEAPRSAWAWLYPPAESTFTHEVDFAFNFIHGVTVVFFVAIILFMLYFAVKFRRRSPQQKALSQKSHSTALELSWTIPPLFICFYMFYIGFTGFMAQAVPPSDAYTIEATAMKWKWTFAHPNGRVDPDVLHVPAGEPVRIRMKSNDVLHSLFIPAFRVKKDVVPGRVTYLWFEAINPTPGAYDPHADKTSDEAGKQVLVNTSLISAHPLFCAEFCGTDHSNMLAKVVVHPRGWRPAELDLSKLPVEVRGREYFKIYGCVGCHQLSPGGVKLVGPSFGEGIFGKTEQMLDGSTVTVDEAYLFESIRYPARKIVVGHAVGQMPPQDAISDEKINDIIEYIKTLGTPAEQK